MHCLQVHSMHVSAAAYSYVSILQSLVSCYILYHMTMGDDLNVAQTHEWQAPGWHVWAYYVRGCNTERLVMATAAIRQDRWSTDVQKVPQGMGSGFFWDDKGHVVTNFHGTNHLFSCLSV